MKFAQNTYIGKLSFEEAREEQDQMLSKIEELSNKYTK